jgi:tetratricopeptide (TPR) repeat protein
MKDNRKPIIKKEVSVNTAFLTTTRIIMIILMLIIIALIIFGAVYIKNIEAQMSTAHTELILQMKADSILTEGDSKVEYYRELSDKSDSAISFILTVVALSVTLTTIFGGFIAFRAPTEIEKKIERLEELEKETQKSIREAKYYTDISRAFAEQLDEEFSIKDQIDALSRVIKNHPDLSHAYYSRSAMYLRLVKCSIKKRQSDDKNIKSDSVKTKSKFNKNEDKLIGLALSDVKTAKALNEDSSKCYNLLGHIYYLQDDYNAAVKYFNLAIKDDKSNYVALYNRGTSYLLMEEYWTAVKDFNELIDANDDYEPAYINRGESYVNIVIRKQYKDDKEKECIIKNIYHDIDTARSIDPTDTECDELLEKANKAIYGEEDKSNKEQERKENEEKMGEPKPPKEEEESPTAADTSASDATDQSDKSESNPENAVETDETIKQGQ